MTAENHMASETIRQLKIKVCGMRIPENIDNICLSGPDYLGFIFYARSKRYIGKYPDPAIFSRVPARIRKVGVFVNEEKNELIRLCRQYNLSAAQLHGNESTDDCRDIRENGIIVIKSFALSESFDFKIVNSYKQSVDYVLFDTAGKLPGGNGNKFKWSTLESYTENIPFFLSGGIGPADVKALKELRHPSLFALDINSGFETEPGLKDAFAIADFIQKIKN